MKFVVAWNLMWALSYLAVAFVDPGVGGPPVWEDILVFLVFGVALLLAACFKAYGKQKGTRVLGKWMLCILAVASVFSGIASFTGVQMWSVPFVNREIFQVAMAFADLVGAAFMLTLALEA